MPDLPPPIPAATLILMRPARDAPELLMMERPETMAFAAGALVFPGGRIDPQDQTAGGSPEAAARFAAVRETIEETGIAAGIAPPLDEGSAVALRRALLAGQLFPEMLAAMGRELDPSALVAFARWCPNFRETRRFDTSFFVAEAPAGAPEPTPQPGEAVRVFWASAAATLGEIDAGRAHAIFPTRRNLERLAQYASFDEARASARRHPLRTITPWVEERAGSRFVCIPEDAGYPVTAEPFATARRR